MLIDHSNGRGPFPRWDMAVADGLLAVPTLTSLAVFAQSAAGRAPTDLPAQVRRLEATPSWTWARRKEA